MKYSVIVPVYNEQDNVKKLHQDIVTTMSGLDDDYEIIFVDDGSGDRTLELLRGIAKKDKTIKIISFSRNFGHQVAITAGIDEASGDAIIVMDADMQDPPEVILEMLVKWEEGFEVVKS